MGEIDQARRLVPDRFVEDAINGHGRTRLVDARERHMYVIVAAAVQGCGEHEFGNHA
jgi:hypothetical protein